MGPCVMYMGLPIWVSYALYGHADIGPICVPYGQAHMGTPIMDPDSNRMSPVWDVNRLAHMGTPIMDPCGTQIASQYGPSVGCIWACPYGSHMLIWASPYGTRVGPISACPYVPYGQAHMGTPMWGPDSKPIWAQCGISSLKC